MLRLCPSGGRRANLLRVSPGASVLLSNSRMPGGVFISFAARELQRLAPVLLFSLCLTIYCFLTSQESTLVQIARPTQCVPGQVQDSCRAPVQVNALTPTLYQVPRPRHLHICCLRRSAPALAVPCSPMPMVTSVSQVAAYQVCSHPASVCLVAHLLHGSRPDVVILGSQRREVAYYSRGE